MNKFNEGDLVLFKDFVFNDEKKLSVNLLKASIISFFFHEENDKYHYFILLDEPHHNIKVIESNEPYLILDIQAMRDKIIKGLLDE